MRRSVLLSFLQGYCSIQRTSQCLAVAMLALSAWASNARAQEGPEAPGGETGGVAAPIDPKKFYLVSSYECHAPGCSFEDRVLRYNGTTGLFDAVHVASINGPYGMTYHPLRGTLLVVSRDDDKVNEYDARTGALIKTFVKPASGSLNFPQHILFHPNGNLLVTSVPNVDLPDRINGIIEYSGKDGSFVRVFKNGGSISPELPEDCGDERCIRGANGMIVNGTKLYVASDINRLVIELDVNTGAYLGNFSDRLINPAFLSVRPSNVDRPGNLLVSSSFPDADINDSIIEFNATTRQRVTFSAGTRDFVNNVARPGPMIWHTDGATILLLGDRTLNQSPPLFADRLARRAAADGVVLNPSTFTATNDSRIHTSTALLQLAYGYAAADEDGDGDTDLRDFAGFQKCMGRSPSTACRNAFDDDLTVSIGWSDFGALRRRFFGPTLPCTTNGQCDDGNSCTTDVCSSGTCTHTSVADGTVCADGLFCNGSETCRAGLCLGLFPCQTPGHCDEPGDRCRECLVNIECDDGNVCTTDSCSASGTCVHTNNTLVCDDGNACTLNDRCSSGVCVGGPPPNCNDSNLCTNDSCDPVIGCRHVHNQNTCNDGNACTIGDRCLLGSCRGGPPPECEDDNECTRDDCDQATGCKFTPISGPACDDGNACTLEDACVAGVCAGTSTTCDDEVACTTNSCNGGDCVFTPNNAFCNDGLFCTGVETCDPVNNCISTGNPCPQGQLCDEEDNRCVACLTNAQCNDNVACTTDLCNGAGNCTNTPNNSACSDGLFCNGSETCNATLGCQAGTSPCTQGQQCDEANDRCVSCLTNGDCNDNVACTTDTCNPSTGVCTNTPNNGACSDGQFCNGNETCHATLGCQAGTPVNCNDSVACTVDTCNETTDSCVNTVNNAACSDGQFCNGDEVCHATLGCQAGTPVNCNDSVSCTVDTCNETTDSCVNTPNNGACSDGQFCNGNETCHATLGCQAGTAPNCGDSVACTTDSCNETTDQCDHTPNDAVCQDGQFCNGQEVCNPSTGCGDGPDPVCNDDLNCTNDSCSAPANACVFTPVNSRCQDNNPCTDNVCTVGVGCEFPADNTNTCADANQCNGAETCQGGTCVPGTPLVCDDLNPCTDDTCVNATGCVFTNDDGNICEDGDFCNGEEFCDAGLCLDGELPDCDDNNPCTDDSCDPELGCLNEPNDGNSCEDNTVCNGVSACVNGSCVPGEALECDDSNPCTDDSCDPVEGCFNDPNDANACSDTDLCTDDACVDGDCVSTPVECDPGDECDPETGDCVPIP